MYQETHDFEPAPRVRYVLPRELDAGFTLTFRRLRRLFLSRGVPREEAADLAQEAIARALLHLNRRGGHDGYEGVDPLLNRIATNLLIDRARAAGPRLVSIESAEEIETGQDPSEEVARLHEYRAVRAAIGQLSTRHRHALLLTLEGMTPAEIADHFGIQRNAADALLHRARRRLADRLRVATDAALGLVALVALRVRSAARRGADLARGLEGYALGPAVLQAASVALVVAVSVPAVAPAAPAFREVRTADAALVVGADSLSGAVPSTVRAQRAPTTAPDGADDRARYSAKDQSVHVEKRIEDPFTGNDQTAYAQSWHNRGPSDDRGVTGPVVDQVTSAACDLGADVCDGEIRP